MAHPAILIRVTHLDNSESCFIVDETDPHAFWGWRIQDENIVLKRYPPPSAPRVVVPFKNIKSYEVEVIDGSQEGNNHDNV